MAQQRELYDWLVAHGDDVLTGDSFFHLSAFGSALPGLNLCGAGRVVCLIDPVGDVYACPFAIHDAFLAGNVRCPAASRRCGSTASCSPSCASRSPAAPARRASSTTPARAAAWRRSSSPGLPLDGPDPECVQGYGELALAGVSAPRSRAATTRTQRRRPRRARGAGRGPVPLTLSTPPPVKAAREPAGGCHRLNAWFESVAEAQRRAQKRLPKSVYSALLAGSEHGSHPRRTTSTPASELGFAPHVAGHARAPRPVHDGDGRQTLSMPVICSARPGCRPCTPTARSRWPGAAAAAASRSGLSSFAHQAGRGGRRRQRADVLPALLVRLEGADRRPARARGEGRRRRGHPDARLVVHPQPRLGQPADPGAPRPARRWCGWRPRSCAGPRWLAALGRSGGAPRPDRPQHGARRRASRRRRSSVPTASGCRPRRPRGRTCAWLREQWDGPLMLKGVMRVDDARRGGRRRASPASPCQQPRRQQPRRHPGVRSGPCRRSPRRSARRSRWSSTAGSAAAATS